MRTLLLRCGSLLIGLLALGIVPMSLFAQSREEKVRADREKVTREGFWIYNDLARGMAEARSSGKPLLVNLRCIPCEECVKLDDDLVDQDPVIRPLLEQFVCVRIVGTNGLDLSLFQYDTDQSFAVFMLNADGTIYGRFGTRSHRTDWIGDVSLQGMAEALRGALELHRDPSRHAALAAKKGAPLEFATPEKYPTLQSKYTSSLDYEGNVVKSCIHCHQIGEARREFYRSKDEPIPESLLYPYPHPKELGLIFNPETRSTLKEVTAGSLAEQAGFRAGDVVETLEGQPLLSIADVQWVLHQANPQGTTIHAVIRRGTESLQRSIDLPKGWRQNGDLSWRASSWMLRRMTTGGILMTPLEPEERRSLGIPSDRMALMAKHVGEYGEHAAAKKAGVKKGDLIVAYDGREDLIRESDVFRHGMTVRKPGDMVALTLLRDGQKVEVTIPMQK